MKEEVIIAGAGGQGILLVAHLLSQAATEEGKYVTCYSSYGAEMRGGTVNSTVIISDEEIGSPVVIHPKSWIIMNSQSWRKFLSRFKNALLVLVNSSLVSTNCDELVKSIEKVSATELAQQIGEVRCANVILLGRYIFLTKVVKIETVIKVIKETFAKKVAEINIQALLQGFQFSNHANFSY